MISPDDPRLTAHASGDLSPEEVARFETELASDPAARAEVGRLRALQAELTAAFGEEGAEVDVPAGAEVEKRSGRETARPSIGQWWRETAFLSFGQFAAAVGVILFLGAVITPTVGRVRETAWRSVDGSNLRQIGQASLIYASDHQNTLPGAAAADVWDYARLAALDGGLNDASIWAVNGDPGVTEQYGALSTVLNRDRDGLEQAFSKLKLSWAVALHPELSANSPSSTPIAWTRGLQPDGTWAAHSPYGTQGGHVVFLGGNVSFYRNTRDEFVRFDGKGRSSDVRDALPPGARIAEYMPTAKEARAWARAKRVQQVMENRVKPFVLPVAWLLVGAVLLTQALRRRWSFSWFVWYMLLTLIAAVVTPTVSH